MPSTAQRWHPIQAVNAYAIRLGWAGQPMTPETLEFGLRHLGFPPQ
ncbi:hypothetical protein [Streptomyces sp. NPDC018693]